jgi:two-component system, cell cycle sensor histidine kinase and response regulator CckA
LSDSNDNVGTGMPVPEGDQAYVALFHGHPSPMMIFDVETLDILDVNEAAVGMYGYSRDEFLRLNIRDIRPAEDIPLLEDTVARAGTGLHQAGEWRHLLKDGTLVDVRIVTHRIGFRGRPARLVSVEDITETRRSEEQLRLLSAGLHAAANAILITDRDGVIQWVNPAFTAMTGYTRDEAIGATPRQLLRSGEHQEAFYRDLWTTVLRGEVWRGQLVNRRKDGTLYQEEQTITPVRDAGGQVRHFIAVKEDVTRRLEAEDALRRSEERYRTLFDGIPVGLYRSTPEGQFVDVNAALVGLLGCQDRAELLAMSVLDLYEGPGARQRFLSLLESADEVRGLDLRLRRADGRGIWARLHAAVERGLDGEVLFIEGSLEDVTERRANEDQLGFQSQLLDAVGEAVIATDMEGRIQYWSHRAEALIGWSASEVMGRDVVDTTVPDAARGKVRERMAEVRAGEVCSVELELHRRDGTAVPVQVTEAPIHDELERVVGVVGVYRDLSAQRSLEQQLRHAQKMEAVGRLAGGIAHDFNNVLTAIQGHTEFLIEALPEGDLREDARVVQRSAQRAGRLTQQLLAFSRKQVLKPQVLDLGVAVRELEGLLRPTIGADITLSIKAEPEAGRVAADPGQIEQVVMNLVVNARDAMPNGGVIELAVRPSEPGELETAIPEAAPAGPHMVMEVRDTGVGMDAAVLDRLFEPFFTTKPAGEGTGLGLSTAYGIVRQSGGHVTVESEPERGTTFRVYLPRVDEPVSPVPRTPQGREGRGPWQIILLVEDEHAVRSLARRVLERAGHEVIEAASPGEALAHLEAPGADDIGLVVTDVVMPEMSGIDLVERVLEKRPELPVIYMSGYAEDEAVRRGMTDERHRFLAKPFTPAELCRIVDEVLGIHT